MKKIEILLGKKLPDVSKIEKMCKEANVNYNKVNVIIDEFNKDGEFVTDEVISKMYKNSSNKSKKVAEILNVLTFAHIDICEGDDKDADCKKYLTDIKNIINESNYKNLDKFYTSVLDYIESNDDNKFSLDSIVSDNQSSTNYVDKLVSDKNENKENKHVRVTINKTIEDEVLDMIEENAVSEDEINEENDNVEQTEEKIENPIESLLNDDINDKYTGNNISSKDSDDASEKINNVLSNEPPKVDPKYASEKINNVLSNEPPKVDPKYASEKINVTDERNNIETIFVDENTFNHMKDNLFKSCTRTLKKDDLNRIKKNLNNNKNKEII